MVHKSYNELKARMLQHFGPKYSEIVERYKFHTIRQNELQGMAEFLRALKHQVTRCEYGISQR